MRTVAATISLILFPALPAESHSQQSTADFDGAWRLVEVVITRPDTILKTTWQGIVVRHNGYFANLQIGPAPAGADEVLRPVTPEEKAARYNLLTANAGTFEVHDSTLIAHFELAKNPAAMGATARVTFRLVADTLWETETSRWVRDTSKLVQMTGKFVRQR